MKRLSSRFTFFNKKIFPVLWFGLLAGMAGKVLWQGAPLFILVAVGFMGLFGLVLFRVLVFDLMDEVYDHGDRLLVKNGGQEDFILLSQVKNLSASLVVNPQRITLSLRTPCRFGTQVSFMPPAPPLTRLFSPHPLIEELIDRVDRERSR